MLKRLLILFAVAFIYIGWVLLEAKRDNMRMAGWAAVAGVFVMCCYALLASSQ